VAKRLAAVACHRIKGPAMTRCLVRARVTAGGACRIPWGQPVLLVAVTNPKCSLTLEPPPPTRPPERSVDERLVRRVGGRPAVRPARGITGASVPGASPKPTPGPLRQWRQKRRATSGAATAGATALPLFGWVAAAWPMRRLLAAAAALALRARAAGCRGHDMGACLKNLHCSASIGMMWGGGGVQAPAHSAHKVASRERVGRCCGAV